MKWLVLALALAMGGVTIEIEGEDFRIYNGTGTAVTCYVSYSDGDVDKVHVRAGRYSRWLDYWRYSSLDCY